MWKEEGCDNTVVRKSRPFSLSWSSVLKHKTEKVLCKLTSYFKKGGAGENRKNKSCELKTKVIGSRGKCKEKGLKGRFIKEHGLHQS